MLANNVQESTTSTGIGSVTLAGSSQDGRTFSSQYIINQRFTYFIDDGAGNFETGVGYLSSSTVLVRELPQDGSEALPVNFGAGTKQVFVSNSKATSINNAAGFLTVSGASKICKPDSVVNGTNRNTAANQIVYIPSLFNRGMTIDLLGVSVASAPAAASMLAGVYDVDPLSGAPKNLLTETTTINPNSTGLVTGSLPSDFDLTPGWHYLALWTDTAGISLRSSSGSSLISNPFGIGGASGLGSVLFQNVSSLTNLPAVAAPSSLSAGGSSFNIVLVGHS